MTKTPRLTSPSMRRIQWTAVILCAAAIAINYLDRSTIAVANPEIRRVFSLTAAQFGALQSAWSIAFALAQIPVGLLVDRLGAGLLLGISLICWSIAVAAGGFANSYNQLLIARFVLGVAESPAYPVAVRVTSNWFQLSDRGVPTGVFNMGANVGTAIAPPLLTALMLLFGWRYMFVAMGVVGIGAALLWFMLYRDPQKVRLSAAELTYLASNKSLRGRAGITTREWGRLFRFRTTWIMICGAFCSSYGLWMYITWLPGYLEGQQHISIARTGFLASIPLVCSAIGSFCGGYASDFLVARGVAILQARKLPTVLGILGAAVFTTLAADAAGAAQAILWISLAMFSLWFGLAAKWTLITAISPQDYCASCSSISNFGAYVGGTCSPFITGLVVDSTGSFVLALVIAGAIMTVGAALYYFFLTTPITDADLEPTYARSVHV